MGKSKKRVRYDSGRESDRIRTQAGIDANNVGEAIEAAIEQRNAEIASEIAATTEGEVEQTVPTTTETGTAEQTTPASTAPEEPTQEPQTGACKPAIHWSANPSVEFRNANTEFLTILSESGMSDDDIETTEEYLLSQGSEEDALKLILNEINQHKAINQSNQTNKEDQIMADNNTNPNITTPVDTNATAMAAAMQQQAAVAAVPPAASQGMSTTEKVVLYTAAGVAVVGLIVGVVALAKAAKANNAIANMGDGIM